MSLLAAQRCANHPFREAVARCMSCGRSFCRECVAEHDDRMLCSSCLAASAKTGRATSFHIADVAAVVQAAAGFFVVWLFFYYLAQVLFAIPTDFHDGTVWSSSRWEADR